MTTSYGADVTVPLRRHTGTLTFTPGVSTDGTDDISLNYFVQGAFEAAKIVLYRPGGVKLGEIVQYNLNVPISMSIPKEALANDGTYGYGKWQANLNVRIAGVWSFDRSADTAITFSSGTPPPPPPPPPPDPCANCGPGTHCENGTCVADPIPPPPPPGPTWFERLKALFPAQLQQYAVPITIGVGYLAYTGLKKKR